jgi:hypothetical protein
MTSRRRTSPGDRITALYAPSYNDGVRPSWLIACVVAAVGCRQILGIDDPDPTALDADADVDSAVDGSPVDAFADRDSDGIGDLADNCPETPNTAQADEDADAFGDVCDNCPHLGNATQDDSGEVAAGSVADGVGDACDPEPAVSGNSIALFLPFNDPLEVETWLVAGTDAAFEVAQGRLRQTGGTDLGIFWRNDLGFAEAWITTRATYDQVDESQQWNGVSLLARFARTTDFGRGAGCGVHSDTSYEFGQPFFALMRFDSVGFAATDSGSGATVQNGHIETITTHHTTASQVACTVGSEMFSSSVPAQTGTGICFVVFGATVSFDYLVVID